MSSVKRRDEGLDGGDRPWRDAMPAFFDKYISHCFVGPIITAAFRGRQRLGADDTFPLPEGAEAERLAAELTAAVRGQAAGSAEAGSRRECSTVGFRLALASLVRVELGIAGAAQAVNVLCLAALPVLVRNLLVSIQDGSAGGAGWAVGAGVSLMVGNLCNQIHYRLMDICAAKLRAACVAVLFRNALRKRDSAAGRRSPAELVALVATDTERFRDAAPFLHLIWASPLQIVAGAVTVALIFGYAALAGVAALLLMYPLSSALSGLMRRQRQRVQPWVDRRTRLISELLQGIRVIKMSGWERPMAAMVDEVRGVELRSLCVEFCVHTILTSMLIVMGQIAAVFAFTVKTLASGPLNAADTFAFMTMVSLLKFPVMLFGQCMMFSSQLLVATDRIGAFVSQTIDLSEAGGDVDPAWEGDLSPMGSVTVLPSAASLRSLDAELGASPLARSPARGERGELVMRLEGGVYVWSEGQAAAPAKAADQREPAGDLAAAGAATEGIVAPGFCLGPLSLELRRGRPVAVVGPVGSGKSMLAMSVLGETHRVGGAEPACCGAGLRFAFSAQEPFLLSATVRENIVFGLPDHQPRYERCVESCELVTDLASLADGDATVVGERGVTLSGGQKARIALARACYAALHWERAAAAGRRLASAGSLDDCSGAGAQGPGGGQAGARTGEMPGVVVVFDDPFSALDAPTAKRVLEALLDPHGGLLRRHAVLFTTHGAANLTYASSVVYLSGGRVERTQEHTPGCDAADCGDDGGREEHESSGGAASGAEGATGGGQPEEGMEAGVVSGSTYRRYISHGTWAWPVVFVLGLLLERFCFASTDIWLSIWTSAESGAPTHQYASLFSGLPSAASRGDGIFAGDGRGSDFYLLIYGVVVAGTFLAGLFRLMAFYIGGIIAVRSLFRSAFSSVMRAPMSFFDTTPAGRILMRLTDDIDRCQYPLIAQANSVLAGFGWIVVGIVLTAVASPFLLLVTLPSVFFVMMMIVYFRSANSHLMRADAVTRSTVQGFVFESLNGAAAVRAFGRCPAFVSRCDSLVDRNTRASLSFAAGQRWIGIRAELVGGLLVLVVALVAWVLREHVPPSIAGVAFVWSFNIAKSFTYQVTDGVQGEAKFVSVERLLEFVNGLPQEGPRRIPGSDPAGDCHPAAAAKVGASPDEPTMCETELPRSADAGGFVEWPTSGAVEFRQVEMRYRPELPLALRGCSLRIGAGMRVGIVGRTGSGKSSLVAALFRLRELDGGAVLLDGRDISGIGLDFLRGGRLCVIPQDPVVFNGTVRSNVDPFEEHSDAAVDGALAAVCLADTVREMGGLGAAIADRGGNLSVGQRQLLCIARAVLRRPVVLVMDEATASVDSATDAVIRSTVRRLFAGATVIEIAHRLRSVADADRVFVMAAGVLAEEGAPHELLARGGEFAEMIAASGDAPELHQLISTAAATSNRA